MSFGNNPFATNPLANSPFADNPYQSPAHGEVIYQAETVSEQGLWRKRNLLVMHKGATLPSRCVKSNVPTQRRLKRSLSWHEPILFLTILAGLLIYVIIALLLRKTATIHSGLSDEWFAKRRRTILIAWMLVLASIGMIVAGFATVDRNSAFAWLIVIGFPLFFIGAIYGLVAARMVAPVRITDTHVWLKRVCPEFLQGLPEWPHTP